MLRCWNILEEYPLHQPARDVSRERNIASVRCVRRPCYSSQCAVTNYRRQCISFFPHTSSYNTNKCTGTPPHNTNVCTPITTMPKLYSGTCITYKLYSSTCITYIHALDPSCACMTCAGMGALRIVSKILTCATA